MWECYNRQLKTIDESKGSVLGYQLATGIISREGILFYVAYLVRFLAQLGLVVGAMMIIRTGYQAALSAIDGESQVSRQEPIISIIK